MPQKHQRGKRLEDVSFQPSFALGCQVTARKGGQAGPGPSSCPAVRGGRRRGTPGDAGARGGGGGGGGGETCPQGGRGSSRQGGVWGGAGPLREGGEPRAARKQRKAVNGTARPERPASKALSSLGTAWQGRESSRALEVLRFLLPVLLKPRAETKGLLATSSSSSSSFCPPGDPFGLAAHAWSSSAESQLFLS